MTTHTTIATDADLERWTEDADQPFYFVDDTVARGYIAFCTEDGDWYATRPTDEDDLREDGTYPAGVTVALESLVPFTVGRVTSFGPAPAVIDAGHLERQRAFSLATFGPGARPAGVLDHIRKELKEIEAAPADLVEWVDVVILALDGALRAGHEPQEIIDAVLAKQARNETRTWPDWRTADPDKAIEHDRTHEPTPGHGFIAVAGHEDDDECTDRADGTDATYCGLPAAAHEATA